MKRIIAIVRPEMLEPLKDDANAIWAFDNWGDQEGALKGTAWRNLIDTNKRIQVVEKDVAELSKKVDAIAKKLGA